VLKSGKQNSQSNNRTLERITTMPAKKKTVKPVGRMFTLWLSATENEKLLKLAARKNISMAAILKGNLK